MTCITNQLVLRRNYNLNFKNVQKKVCNIEISEIEKHNNDNN